MTSFSHLHYSPPAPILSLLLIIILIPPPPIQSAPPPGLTFGGVFYPTNFLGYALETNYAARTNAIPNYNPAADQPWTGYQSGSTNVAKYRLNPNSVIYEKRGATGISVAQLSGTQARFTLLTKRHAVTAGHYAEGFPKIGPNASWHGAKVWFIGTNGTTHVMTIANSFVGDGEDRLTVIFRTDVPNDVQPMCIAAPLTNRLTGLIYAPVQDYFPPEARSPFGPSAAFSVCQHGYCGRIGQSHPSGGRIGFDGGDSGSPGFFILRDQCIYVGGVSMNVPTTNMLHRMDDLTRSLGLNPTNYQPSYVWLTNYPTWPN